MFLKMLGTIEFQPMDLTKKHADQSTWKKVAIVKFDCDVDRYYRWFIEKRYNLELTPSIRYAHVTFINDHIKRDFAGDGEANYKRIIEKYDGKVVEVYLDIRTKTSGDHWWLRAYSNTLSDIREECGLKRDPYYGLHMTVGSPLLMLSKVQGDSIGIKAKKDFIEHSHYIMRMERFFNVPYSPRINNFNPKKVHAISPSKEFQELYTRAKELKGILNKLGRNYMINKKEIKGYTKEYKDVKNEMQEIISKK